MKMAAEMIVYEIRAQAGGDLSSAVVLPMATASQLIGLSTKHLPFHLPITAVAPGKHGVTLRALQEHISKNTRQPS
jgi:hypothetical protein